MREDKSVLKLTGEQEGQPVKEDVHSSNLPYYWSWYQLVFPSHAPPKGERAVPSRPEGG